MAADKGTVLMSRLHFVKSANKAYPQAGIAKGDSYYWWQSYRQPRRLSKERPRASQHASSEYEQSVLSLCEALEDANSMWDEGDRDQLVSDLEAIRDSEQEKFDNLPEGFQLGDTGMLIEERVNNLDDWIGELNNLDFEEVNEDETPWEQAINSMGRII